MFNIAHNFPKSARSSRTSQWEILLVVERFKKGLVKSLVMQINHDGFLRVMHIPEDSLAVLIESSGSNHAGHTGSGHPHAMPPSACDLRVGSDACDVDERYFEAAKAQSLSTPWTFNINLPSAMDKSTKATLLWLTHLNHNRDVEFRIIFLHVSCAVLLAKFLDYGLHGCRVGDGLCP